MAQRYEGREMEQVQAQLLETLNSLTAQMKNVDLEAVATRRRQAGPQAELNSFGSAGTLGTLTSCFGTLGTFGSAGATDISVK